MILTRGEKVRLKSSGEGAEIIQVLDAHTAIVETFDGEIQVKSVEVVPFAAADAQQGEADKAITFLAKPEKKTPKKNTTAFQQDRRTNFAYTLDLHADKLIGDVSTKTNEEILSIQLSRLKAYIQEAVELHIQRVYIIHGIGSGRLKTEVYDFLYKHPKVVRFANDYHPQYGMGATEVKFR